MGKSAKKRKKKIEGDDVESLESSDTGSIMEVEDKDRYKPFRIPNYTRQYPEDGRYFEYIVFLESVEPDKPLGNRDMMSLANNLKKHNKGIKQLKRINKYKIGVIFERSGLANAALTNTNFLNANKLKASIPAAATEVTGVIIHVPIELSNEQIYSTLTSTKNIICIRRFMRKIDNELQPTKTVSITFSSTTGDSK